MAFQIKIDYDIIDGKSKFDFKTFVLLRSSTQVTPGRRLYSEKIDGFFDARRGEACGVARPTFFVHN